MTESINSSYARECKRGWAGGEHTVTGQGWEACEITSEPPTTAREAGSPEGN